ncbi:uncharacterized protein ARMOST_18834 [Armillaria ostoyae]|uniref:Uncharacterized protein n=1 Tax=Armillaria ostoyae TaxID=47428 RepID=A0A284S2V2_ARMOS|nr:uncharacterized protein ARMOST_18834 [Armillaria ostoyae]
MTLQVSTSVPPSVGETLGVLYVGATIATVLFGITNLQAVIYYKRYLNDWWLYRYSVALLWVLDTLHAVLSTHAVYFHLIDMFGNLAGALVHTIWSFQAQLGINVVIVLYVPGLYAIWLWKHLCLCGYGTRQGLANFISVGRHFHRIFPLFTFLAVAAALGNSITSLVSTISPDCAPASFRCWNIYGLWHFHYAKSLSSFRYQNIHSHLLLYSSGDRFCDSLHDVLLLAQDQRGYESIYHSFSCTQPNATHYGVGVGYKYMLAIDSYLGWSSSQV